MDATSCNSRGLVMERANHPQYDEISPWYLPYSNVEELYSFSKKRNGVIRGIGKDFLLNFMERCVAAEHTDSFSFGYTSIQEYAAEESNA